MIRPFSKESLRSELARITARKNSAGTVFGPRRRFNFIEGSQVLLTVAEDAANDEIDITITSTGATATHDLLSTTHGDTAAGSPVRGDLILADSNPVWTKLAIGAANRVLRSDGTDPSWAQVALATDVTGVLPIANGGTGESAALDAFDALSPMTTRGDLITRGSSNNIRLAVGAVDTVLKSDGTDPLWDLLTGNEFADQADGTVFAGPAGGPAATPTFRALVETDLPSLTSAQWAAHTTDETGSGALVFATSPTIVTPTIASFTNAQHDHDDAAGGGLLPAYLLLAGRAGSGNDFTMSTSGNAILTGTTAADATLSLRCGTATDPGPILLFDHLTSLAGADVESLLGALTQSSLPFTNTAKSVTILEVGSVGFGTRAAWQMNQNMLSAVGAGGRVFVFRPRIQQESGETRTDGGAWQAFMHLPEFHALNADLTIPISRALVSQVETSRTGTPTGVLTEDTAVFMQPTYATGWSCTTRRIAWALDNAGAGAQVDFVGIDIERQTCTNANDILGARFLGCGIEFDEYSGTGDMDAPATDRVRLYARDDGAGKTQIVARFATGDVQVIATEP